jgi:hypothetical protein
VTVTSAISGFTPAADDFPGAVGPRPPHPRQLRRWNQPFSRTCCSSTVFASTIWPAETIVHA